MWFGMNRLTSHTATPQPSHRLTGTICELAHGSTYGVPWCGLCGRGWMCKPSHLRAVFATPPLNRNGLLDADRWVHVVFEASPRLTRSRIERFSARERRIGYCDVKSLNCGTSPYALRLLFRERTKEKSFHRSGYVITS